MKRFVDQLDVAAVGLVAEELEGVGDDLADQVAVGNLGQLADQFLCGVVDVIQIGSGNYRGNLCGFLGLLEVFGEGVLRLGGLAGLTAHIKSFLVAA